MEKFIDSLEIFFNKQLVVPGDNVSAQAKFNGTFKKTSAGNVKLLNLGGVEEPINFFFHGGERTFEETRYVKIDNSTLSSYNTIQITDVLSSTLKTNPVYNFELPSVYYIEQNDERLAKIELFFNDETVAGKTFSCSTVSDVKLYKIKFKITILKTVTPKTQYTLVNEQYEGYDTKLSFTLNDTSKLNQILVEGI